MNAPKIQRIGRKIPRKNIHPCPFRSVRSPSQIKRTSHRSARKPPVYHHIADLLTRSSSNLLRSRLAGAGNSPAPRRPRTRDPGRSSPVNAVYAGHGNAALCPTCKASRPEGLRRGTPLRFGTRRCHLCFREYQAVAEHQRDCARRCLDRARRHDDAKYARPEHRGTRRLLAPIVASGLVRCARGAACKRAELVDGELVGGFIEPVERWHLGHPDGESVGGPECRECNRAAPSRLAAKARRGL